MAPLGKRSKFSEILIFSCRKKYENFDTNTRFGNRGIFSLICLNWLRAFLSGIFLDFFFTNWACKRAFQDGFLKFYNFDLKNLVNYAFEAQNCSIFSNLGSKFNIMVPRASSYLFKIDHAPMTIFGQKWPTEKIKNLQIATRNL